MGQLNRFTQHGQQGIGQGCQLVRLLQIGDQHQKLVSPEAGRQIVVLQAAADTLCQPLEQLIANSVAQAVVDQLEAIQIDKEQPQPFAIELRGFQLKGQPLLQQMAIAQFGQGVVIGKVIQFGLHLANGADVGEGDHIVSSVVEVVIDSADLLPGGEVAAILAQTNHLAMPGVVAGAQVIPGIVEVGVAPGMHDDIRGAAYHLLGIVLGQHGEGRVDRQNMVLAVEDDDPLGRGIEYHVGLMEPLLLTAAGGGIVNDPHDPVADRLGGGDMVGMNIDPVALVESGEVAQGEMDGVMTLQGGLELAAGFRFKTVDERLQPAVELVGLDAQQRLNLAVEQQSVLRHVPLPHPDLGRSHCQLQPLFGFVLLGDVPHDGEDTVQLPFLITHRAVGGLKAAGAAVVRRGLARDGDIHVGHAASHDLLKHGLQGRGQLGNHLSEVLALMLLDAFAIDVGQHLIDFTVAKFAVKDADAQRGIIHQLFQDGVI